ncbi:hypothetical protein V6Z12_D02G095700 [Gossypium hirsutum]
MENEFQNAGKMTYILGNYLTVSISVRHFPKALRKFPVPLRLKASEILLQIQD